MSTDVAFAHAVPAKGESPIKTYHVERLRPEALRALVKLGVSRLYAEAKYDGTHLILHADGVNKHDGGPAERWQVDGLLRALRAHPEKADAIARAIEAGLVLAVELFGSAYTPAGFHADHDSEWDVVVFEISRGGSWLPPEEKYAVAERFGLPIPEYVVVDLNDVTSVERELQRLAGQEWCHEGLVVKAAAPDRWRGEKALRGFLKPRHRPSIFIAKVKVKRARTSVQKIKRKKKSRKERMAERAKAAAGSLSEDVKAEIRDEIVKIAAERGSDYVNPRNMGEIIARVVAHLLGHEALRDEVTANIKEVKRYISSQVFEYMESAASG